MGKKISQETYKRIIELYRNGEGLHIDEIAKETGVSYSSAYRLTKLIRRTNPETGQPFASYLEYNEYLAKQRGYKSHTDYLKHQAMQRTNPETGQPFASYLEYNEYLAKQRGFNSYPEYLEHLAKRSGYASYRDYEKYLGIERQKRPENMRISYLIKEKLARMKKTQCWLAEKTGISRQAISVYSLGKALPSEDILQKLCCTLCIPSMSLDELCRVAA